VTLWLIRPSEQRWQTSLLGRTLKTSVPSATLSLLVCHSNGQCPLRWLLCHFGSQGKDNTENPQLSEDNAEWVRNDLCSGHCWDWGPSAPAEEPGLLSLTEGQGGELTSLPAWLVTVMEGALPRSFKCCTVLLKFTVEFQFLVFLWLLRREDYLSIFSYCCIYFWVRRGMKRRNPCKCIYFWGSKEVWRRNKYVNGN
jgi:hypothetical protein